MDIVSSLLFMALSSPSSGKCCGRILHTPRRKAVKERSHRPKHGGAILGCCQHPVSEGQHCASTDCLHVPSEFSTLPCLE
jgi:hypothetical protein